MATLDPVAPVLESLSSLTEAHVRTLDALHLTSVRFLVDQGVEVEIATYDRRLANAAEQVGLSVADWI